jgi:tRNA A-37 threonylcarbamoyl transferase component Bud32
MFPIEIVDEKIMDTIIEDNDLRARGLCPVGKKMYCTEEKCLTNVKITNDVVGQGSGGIVYRACSVDDCSFVAKCSRDVEISANEVLIQNAASNYHLAPVIRQFLICKRMAIIIMDGLDKTVLQLLQRISPENEERLIKKYLIEIHNVIEYMVLEEQIVVPKITTIKELMNFLYVMKLKISYEYPTMDQTMIDASVPKFEIDFEDSEEEKKFKIDLVTKAFEKIHKLHQRGIYHGDLHFSNIMANSEGKLFIIDFGFSEFTKNKAEQKLDFLHAIKMLKSACENSGRVNIQYVVDYLVDLYENFYRSQY